MPSNDYIERFLGNVGKVQFNIAGDKKVYDWTWVGAINPNLVGIWVQTIVFPVINCNFFKFCSRSVCLFLNPVTCVQLPELVHHLLKKRILNC